jgi:hypothetical protein
MPSFSLVNSWRLGGLVGLIVALLFKFAGKSFSISRGGEFE